MVLFCILLTTIKLVIIKFIYFHNLSISISVSSSYFNFYQFLFNPLYYFFFLINIRDKYDLTFFCKIRSVWILAVFAIYFLHSNLRIFFFYTFKLIILSTGLFFLLFSYNYFLFFIVVNISIFIVVVQFLSSRLLLFTLLFGLLFSLNPRRCLFFLFLFYRKAATSVTRISNKLQTYFLCTTPGCLEIVYEYYIFFSLSVLVTVSNLLLFLLLFNIFFYIYLYFKLLKISSLLQLLDQDSLLKQLKIKYISFIFLFSFLVFFTYIEFCASVNCWL